MNNESPCHYSYIPPDSVAKTICEHWPVIKKNTWSTVKYSQKLWLSPTENIKAQKTFWWELKCQHTKQGLNNAKCVGIGSTRLKQHIETIQKFHSKITGEECTMHLLQILQFRMWHMWVKQSCRFINVWIIMRDIICKPKLTYHFGLSHECRSYKIKIFENNPKWEMSRHERESFWRRKVRTL